MILKRLFIKHIYRDKNGVKSDRGKIKRDYEQETGNEISIYSIKHYVTKFDREECWRLSRGKLPTRKEQDYGIDVTQKEGLYYSNKYIEIDNQSKLGPNEVMLAHGFDPLEFEIINTGSTGSKIGTSKNDEQYFINTYRKLTVRPIKPEAISHALIKKLLTETIDPIESIPFSKGANKKAFEVDFFDIHVNSTGYAREVVMKKVSKMREYIIANEFEKVIIVFGGDFLHVNDTNEKTVAGTQLKLVGSAYEMVREGERLARFIIEQLSVVKTDVQWVLGNHSDLPEYQLFSKLELLFNNSTHIKFYVDETPYKAYVYGSQFVMLSHGNIGIKEIQTLPSQRFPTLWAKAKYWEVHLGHIHHENVKSFGSLVVRYQRTPKSTDSWEFYKGWYNDLNHIQCYSIDYEKGIDGVLYF